MSNDIKSASLDYRPHGKPVEVAPGVTRVTFGTERRVAPQLIRARVALGGMLEATVSGGSMTEPQIIAQAQDSSWITWEARKH